MSTIAVSDDIRTPLPSDIYQGDLLEHRGIFKRVFNANTRDFLYGAATVGSLSYATRIGVLSAATAAGAGALPAVLAAGAATGLITGSYRFYREYQKARYDFGDPQVRKILRNQLLMSTALSTIGGGVGYAFVNHYDVIAEMAQKTGVPAWVNSNLTALANSSVGLAVAEIAAPVKTAVVEAYNRAVPGIAAMVEAGKVFAGRAYDSLPEGMSAGVENAMQSVKGWWKSAMNVVGLSQAAQASTPDAADNSLTFAERMDGVNNVSVVEQTVEPVTQATAPQDVPVAAGDHSKIPVHTVKSIRVLPDGTIVSDDVPQPAAAAEVAVADNSAYGETSSQPVKTVKIIPQDAPVPDAAPPQAPVAVAQAQDPFSVPPSQPVTPEELVALEQMEAQRTETPLYVQDYFARPQGDFAIKQPMPSFAGLDFVRTPDGLALPELDANSTPKYLQKLSETFTIRSWANPFDDMAAGVTPENFERVFAEFQLSLSKDHLATSNFSNKAFTDRGAQIVAKAASGDLPVQGLPVQKDIAVAVAPPSAPEPVPAAVPVPAPGSMKEQIGSYFEGKNLSRRAERIMEKAMNGDLQGQKDLAMNLLHGKGGFPKDSAMAMKLYDNVIAEGSVEGKYPRSAVFQALRDKAWVQFYGYGDVPQDQEAAKSAIRKLAEFNSGARRMLREWTGERVSHIATASQHAVASVKESVAGKMPDRLSCKWLKAGNTVVSGTCKGGLSLKVGDKITLNP